MNTFDLSRNFWNWAFDNPELISPNHSAIFFFAIEHCNRLGGKDKFGFPSQMTMEAIGIKKHSTYIRYFNNLVDWGFFKLIQKSHNQYSSNIISLVYALPKKGKALDKANMNHRDNQSESNGQSKRSIDKQPNNLTTKPLKYIDLMETPNLQYINEIISDSKKDQDKKFMLVFSGVVKISCYDYDKLLKKYHYRDIQIKINSLSAGIHNKNKKYINYKDHYRTILNWLGKDCKEKSNYPTKHITL